MENEILNNVENRVTCATCATHGRLLALIRGECVQTKIHTETQPPELTPLAMTNTTRRCWHCDHWQEKPGFCWWSGVCGLYDHNVGMRSLCREVPPYA